MDVGGALPSTVCSRGWDTVRTQVYARLCSRRRRGCARTRLGAGRRVRVQRSAVRPFVVSVAVVVSGRGVRHAARQRQRKRVLFYEGDFSTLFEERSYGAFAQVRYPFNRFRRIVGEYRIERSDRLDLTTQDVDEPRRVGWLVSNYLTYVKDNTLWLSTGPIDGERYNLTGGLVNDLSHGRFDSWLVS